MESIQFVEYKSINYLVDVNVFSKRKVNIVNQCNIKNLIIEKGYTWSIKQRGHFHDQWSTRHCLVGGTWQNLIRKNR